MSTLAGLAGSAGSTDDTGSAARFAYPQGLTVDSADNVFVADTNNHTIRRITNGAVVSTWAGLAGNSGSADGMGNAARFNSPKGVTMDSDGNAYVGDSSNFTIRKITPFRVVSTVAGLARNPGSADSTGNAARFNGPESVAVDNTGNVIVADAGNHTIRNVNSAYVVTTVAGLAGESGSIDRISTRFSSPTSVAVDSVGNAYVADTDNFTIRKITPTGVVTTLAGLAGVSGSDDGIGSAARFNHAQGVAADNGGNVYVADTDNYTIRKITPAGVVTTLAGLAGVSGSADGNGSAARFDYPGGVAVDSVGNVYVADTSNNTIRKITPAGVVTTLAGLAGNPGSADGTGSAARFYAPRGVAADMAGTAYVVDTGNSTIRKITPAGVVTTLAGLAGNPGSADGTGSAARFNYPFGVAVDSGAYVYVADYINLTIRKITPAGVVTTLAGLAGNPGSADGTGSAARFNYPFGVAVDSGAYVYVADSHNDTIRKITPGGDVNTLAGVAISGSTDGTDGAARFFNPSGTAVDSAGNVYVADSSNQTIRKITPAGVVTTLAGLAGVIGSADGTGSAARFYAPLGVAVDSGGYVYVADNLNDTIRKITPAGVVTTLAGLAGNPGSADGTGSAARFYYPVGVAVDSGGYVYVADFSNFTIRKITPAGVVTTLAGLAGNSGSDDGTGSAARFSYPTSVAVGSVGNVYVSDTGNNTIRKITPAGVVTTLAGLAGNSGSDDGTGSAARFNGAYGVAVDSAGNVYVGDSSNYTIRKITPSGVVTTLAGLAGYLGSADGTGSAARFGYPKGLAVDRDGKVYVADSANCAVRKGVPPPFIESPPTAIGTVNVQFIYQIQALGATSFGATNLPPGLNVDPTLGIIYGNPTTVGQNQVTISASTAQHTTTATLTITIFPLPSGPVIASGASVTGRTGGLFTFDVITTGSTTANISASGLPPGLSINPLTGFISGTPTSDNSSLVTLSATDGVGVHTSTLQLTFASDPAVPIITSPESVTFVPGQPFSYTITADASATFTYIGTNGVENEPLPGGLNFQPPTISCSGNCGTITPPPSTIKIRPPLVARIQINANNTNGNRTGTRPLNFFEPAVVSRMSFGSGTFDIALPLPLTGSPGIECRSGGANGNYQVVFAFPTAVTFTNATVTPGSGGSASVSGAPITITTVDGTQVAVNLTNVSNGQTITVTLSGVHDGVNANSVNVSVPMRILVGDANGSGTINSSDVSFVKSQSGKPITDLNFRADVNGNGVINGSDVSLVKLRSGSSLPPAPTAFGQSKIRH